MLSAGSLAVVPSAHKQQTVPLHLLSGSTLVEATFEAGPWQLPAEAPVLADK